MTWTFEATRPGYATMWRSATIKPGADSQNAETFASKIIAGEAQYRQVQTATGVPWYFVGALHMREGSCDFTRALCNGERIIGTGRLTTLVPADRGPYASWYDSGIDAMRLKDLHRVQEWSVERMLFSAEVYNGLGYVGKVNSPYVWAGTTHEQSGMYPRDHVWDPNADDPRIGVAAVLKRLAEKRPDIAAALQSGGEPAQTDLPIHAPAAAPAQPSAPADILPTLLRILTVLQAVMSRQGDFGAMLAQVAAKPTEAPKPPSKLERPSVALGTAGFFAGLLGQLTGVVGPPQGIDAVLNVATSPTVAGTITTLLPLATAAIGATGGWGALAAGALRIVGPMVASAMQQKK